MTLFLNAINSNQPGNAISLTQNSKLHFNENQFYDEIQLLRVTSLKLRLHATMSCTIRSILAY